MELAVFGRMRNEARPPHRAGAAPLRAVRGAGRAVGSQGREPDRLSPARADERRERGHAGHARRDPAARTDAVDARHRAADEADDRRPRRDRPAGDRQHARGRRPHRAAQGRATTTIRSTAKIATSADARFHGLFLALRKRESDIAVQSLDRARRRVPARQAPAAVDLEGDRTPIRFGRLLEQQPDWVWATVESARSHAADARRSTRSWARLRSFPRAAANE